MSCWVLIVAALASAAAHPGAQAAVTKSAPPAAPAPAQTNAPNASQVQPLSAAPAKPAPGQPPPPPASPGAAPASPAPGGAVPPEGGAPAAPTAQPEPYTYNPDGRRDPFLSLIGTGGSELATGVGRRFDGPASMAVADVSVRGVLQSRGALIAMIQGPDNKTYIVHQGDKLLDGVIKTITPQGLIITQEVNDPLSLVKQREVSKLLRSLEVVKP
jgi:Tfp pilus assembly protein PilP